MSACRTSFLQSSQAGPGVPAADTHGSHEDAKPDPMTHASSGAPAQEQEDGDVRLAAGVVTLVPRADLLEALVANLHAMGIQTFVFLNGPLDDALMDRLQLSSPGLTFLSSGRNVGVGAALNKLMQAGADANATDMFLFDQDSTIAPAMIETMVRMRRQMTAAHIAAAVIGPRLASPGKGELAHKSPRIFRRGDASSVVGAGAVWFLPTSGSLVNVAAFLAIGSFRADYFIDSIDLEWCFRAWADGYSCWLAEMAVMTHRVGEGTVAVAPGITMPHQNDMRMAMYVRNSIYGWHLPHVPLRWKLGQAAYIPVQILATWRRRNYRIAYLRLLAQAALDGWRGRLGVPAEAAFRTGAIPLPGGARWPTT